MKFILFSHFLEGTIRDHLGESEYSYYFVLKAYQRALAELGSVEIVRHPESEVDPIYNSCHSRGESCIFFSFAPPHKTQLNLDCPTVPVIAWEFSRIPDEPWGNDPRNDWRFTLAKLGNAITLSSYSERIIAEAMGPKFVVHSVPAPVLDRANCERPASPICAGADLHLAGSILDTATMNLQINSLASSVRPQGDKVANRTNRYQRTRRRLLIWAFERYERFYDLTHSARSNGSDVTPALGSEHYPVGATESPQSRVHVSGVVYTAVLNPTDGRKNVYDIVTAFCWAFRDINDATLVLKLVNRDPQAFYSALIPILYRLSPFKCRVLVLSGFLAENEYDLLIGSTSYYVNASTSEGLCLPLMEFMASGTPAIAPVHTAMEDYIDGEVAFVLRATRQITVWPHDPRELFRTMCFRLDWESLVEAYRQSYRLAKTNPGAYHEMSMRVRQRMQRYASLPTIKEKLRRFLAVLKDSTAAGSSRANTATDEFAARE